MRKSFTIGTIVDIRFISVTWVVSGKIAKQAPDAMVIKTPSSLLGVRGTEFLVKIEGAE